MKANQLKLLISSNTLFILLLSLHSHAQDYLGYTNSNFAGVNAVILQPGAIADPRSKFDLNIVSANLSFNNNIAALKRDGFYSFNTFNNFKDQFPQWKDFKERGLLENLDNETRHLNASFDVMGPSFSLSISPVDALALTTRFRNMAVINDFEPRLVKLAMEEVEYPPHWQQAIAGDQGSIDILSWTEYGLTYARVINKNGEHFFKAGATVKVLQGLYSAYFYVEDGDFTFTNDDTLSISRSTMRYGHSSSFELDGKELYDYRFTGFGLGFDLGLVYEWRPDHEKYFRRYTEGIFESRELNKYRLKAGFSVLDIGGIRFEKDPDSYDFDARVNDWDLTELDFDDIQSFDDTINGRFPNALADNETDYKMSLPLAFSAQVDYRPWMKQNLYLNLTAFVSPTIPDNINKVHQITRLSITPRFEDYWLGFGLPVSYTSYGWDLGMYAKLGPFYMGGNNFFNNIGAKTLYSSTLYFGFKFTVPHGRRIGTSDLDADGVPDMADQCIDVAGPKENNGCPYGDKDQDGVLDNADQCIDVAGPLENNGCPYGDKDQDGVLDNVDKCIDVPGAKENNGCPYSDRDEDGVLDNVDECLDVKGPPENNGCPYSDRDQDGIPDKDDACLDAPGPAENKGCPYLDTDGDQVLDKDDKCPNTPGVAANDGCPEVKAEEEAVVTRAFNNLEFQSGKAVISSASHSSLSELAALLKEHPSWGLLLAGHTDNTGDDEANMILSSNRARAVKDYLVQQGVEASKIVVAYYGETRPIASNDTAKGRQQNRRVEMRLIFD